MKGLSLLIKPSSSLCNLKCRYCFYHDVASKREVKSYGMMSLETLEALVKRAFEETKGFVSFAFQGGEPTLIGLDFYEKLIELQAKYNKDKIDVYNSIQTNATLIDRPFAKFFADNKFLVGVSIDGPPNIHNINRDMTFDKVINAIELLEEYGVEYNVLSVVSSTLAKNPKGVYRFFKNNKIKFLQFIPCLNPLYEEDEVYDYTLTSEDYLNFLKTIFDLWYNDFIKGDYVSIRLFDNYVRMIQGKQPEACGLSGTCSVYGLVEADGSLYPCDFYVLDRYRLGNIKDNSFKEMLESEVANAFVLESLKLPNECLACKWYHMCRGSCKRERSTKDNKNVYCHAYYNFFEYAYDRMETIARQLRG